MANNLIVVFAGPSGSGKSTLVKKLMSDYPDYFAFTVSHTSRLPRPGECDGREYHFTTREKMQIDIEEGKFVEYAEFSGNMYGTSKLAIEDVAKLGKICILDIDMQGVKSMKQTDLKCKYIFVKSPSLEVLEWRLRGRGTENEESLAKRLNTAKEELLYAETPAVFDHIIINDEIDRSYCELLSVLEDYMNIVKRNLQSGDKQ